jgi:AcrR family transcriptional regulator
MPRTVNALANEVRRGAFVDVAQRLIQTKAYEQMSVQDVLDAVGASRGGFYHYFKSKQDLLDAVVARMVDAVIASVAPLLADSNLPALAKLQGLLSGIAAWKAERKELVLGIAQVWLSDDNALVREKLRVRMMDRFAPQLAPILRQGNGEGQFTASSPDDTARVLISLMHGAQLVATQLLLDKHAHLISFDQLERTLHAYSDAHEAILGAPRGSLRMDNAALRFWFDDDAGSREAPVLFREFTARQNPELSVRPASQIANRTGTPERSKR